jgi:hypothetical protein
VGIEKVANGDAGVGIVQMEMKEVDEEGDLLEDVVALRSSEWLRWADDLFALDVERKSTYSAFGQDSRAALCPH